MTCMYDPLQNLPYLVLHIFFIVIFKHIENSGKHAVQYNIVNVSKNKPAAQAAGADPSR